MIEDISLMRTLPNMTVISTSDDTETKWAVEEISKIEGPVYLRLGRLATPVIYDKNQCFEIGKGIQIGEGKDGTGEISSRRGAIVPTFAVQEFKGRNCYYRK